MLVAHGDVLANTMRPIVRMRGQPAIRDGNPVEATTKNPPRRLGGHSITPRWCHSTRGSNGPAAEDFQNFNARRVRLDETGR